MNDAKDNIVTIRLTNEEKATLEQEAKLHGLRLSHYVRYKVLELQEKGVKKQEQTSSSIAFLDQHLHLLTRVILNGYFHTIKLADNQLSEEELAEAEEEALKVINHLGILMPERSLDSES
jgi:hypothetical protein